MPICPILENDFSNFPAAKEFVPLEKLKGNLLEWLSQTSISLYFNERLALKGLEQGRRLFMCGFVKNTRYHQVKENIFFIALCGAEMKTSIDYEVKLQINCQSREIHKAQCQYVQLVLVR